MATCFQPGALLWARGSSSVHISSAEGSCYWEAKHCQMHVRYWVITWHENVARKHKIQLCVQERWRFSPTSSRGASGGPWEAIAPIDPGKFSDSCQTWMYKYLLSFKSRIWNLHTDRGCWGSRRSPGAVLQTWPSSIWTHWQAHLRSLRGCPGWSDKKRWNIIVEICRGLGVTTYMRG